MAAENKDGDRRKGGKGERRPEHRGNQPSSQRSDDGSTGLHQPRFDARYEELDWCITALLSRGDGWLRIVPGDDGKLIYAKYKFTLGRASGTYVMAVSSLRELNAAFVVLLRKVQEVDAGTRRPTPDRYYGGAGPVDAPSILLELDRDGGA